MIFETLLDKLDRSTTIDMKRPSLQESASKLVNLLQFFYGISYKHFMETAYSVLW
jgi:hypothetical protein